MALGQVSGRLTARVQLGVNEMQAWAAGNSGGALPLATAGLRGYCCNASRGQIAATQPLAQVRQCRDCGNPRRLLPLGLAQVLVERTVPLKVCGDGVQAFCGRAHWPRHLGAAKASHLPAAPICKQRYLCSSRAVKPAMPNATRMMKQKHDCIEGRHSGQTHGGSASLFPVCSTRPGGRRRPLALEQSAGLNSKGHWAMSSPHRKPSAGTV